MTTLNMSYFEELREKINTMLHSVGGPHARAQIEEYPWLYGALGAVPSDVMFICENPSLAGVKRAHQQTIYGLRGIEAQWWGSPGNPAARNFRTVLCDTGLKTTPPAEPGGWNCYITNAVKEVAIVKEHNTLGKCTRHDQARTWADILQWELNHVRPKHVFCVGGKSVDLIRMLQRERRVRPFPYTGIWHYSARRGDLVRDKMRSGIQAVLKR